VGTEKKNLLGWGGDDGADVHFRVTLIKFVGAVLVVSRCRLSVRHNRELYPMYTDILDFFLGQVAPIILVVDAIRYYRGI